MPGSFLDFLLISAAAALFLIGAFLLRRRWTPQPTRLRLLLEQETKNQGRQKGLVPLLVYEDDFPSFMEILGLVLEKFPLSRFMKTTEFREALNFLDKSVCERPEAVQLRAAMCQIVRVFLADPDVEYHCRPELAILVDSFLQELDLFDRSRADSQQS